jgi:hypothetical protein
MTILHMHFACSIIKATNTHSEYVKLISFHSNDGYANAPECYVIRALPVLLLSSRPCLGSVSFLHDGHREFLPSSCSYWILNLTIRTLKMPRNIFPLPVCVKWHGCLIQCWWNYCFLPPFIIQSGHYNTLSTTYVVYILTDSIPLC